MNNVMKSYKERIVAEGDDVKVYFDLHQKTFSIQKGQLVHAKSDAVLLKDAKFKVNQNGRNRVIEEGKKNVHAKVHGVFASSIPQEDDFLERHVLGNNIKEASYNPFKFETFVDKETKEPIHSADFVILQDRRVFYLNVL